MPETNNTNSGVVDFDIPNLLKNVNLRFLDDFSMSIYTNSEQTKFFYPPLILVDWKHFKEQIDEKCIDDSEKTVELAIKINHIDDDGNLENEIITSLIQDGKKDPELLIYPHAFYEIHFSIPNNIYRSFDLDYSLTDVVPNTKTTIDKYKYYRLNGTSKQLKRFYENRGIADQIKGTLFSQGFLFSSDFISGFLKVENRIDIEKQIFGDEKKIDEKSVKYSSESSGIGLNLGKLTAGVSGTEGSVTTSETTQRILNRKYVTDIISESSTSIDIKVIGDQNRTKELLNKIIDNLLSSKDKIELEFKPIKENEYQLIKDGIAYAQIGPEISKTLISAKPSNEQTSKIQEEFTFGAIGGKNTNDATFKNTDEITWSFDGNKWIPTKIDMYILSKSTLRSELELAAMIYNKDQKKATATEFLFPAAFLYDSEKTTSVEDKINLLPIGSVIPFAGGKTKLPNGWLLCIGTELDINEYGELFNIIEHKWGGQNNKFNIPNLQGLFLRGVDYDGTHDPEAATRTNSAGEIKEPGSFQPDQFQWHQHGYDTNKVGASNGGTGNDPAKKEFGTALTTGPSGAYGNETRPKNVSVNYIIRAK